MAKRPPAPSPEHVALARIAALAQGGVSTNRMREGVISLALGLRVEHGAEAARQILRNVHGELVEGVIAGEEAISGMDKVEEEKAVAHSMKSLQVLKAARNAVAREAEAPA